MTRETPPSGVMEAEYAAARLSAPHLQFRYRTRARVVAAAWRRHGGDPGAPRLLELGAADGLTLLEMHQLLGPRGQYTGIEYSEELIRTAPALPPGAALLRGDAERLPASLDAGGFDLVVALALLEHLGNPLLALCEAHRVLSSGGLLVATVPVPSWDALSSALGLVRGEHHESRLGHRELIALLATAGFQTLEHGRFMWAPVSFLPYLRLRVPEDLALRVDRLVGAIPLTRWMFVNQYFIARKP